MKVLDLEDFDAQLEVYVRSIVVGSLSIVLLHLGIRIMQNLRLSFLLYKPSRGVTLARDFVKKPTHPLTLLTVLYMGIKPNQLISNYYISLYYLQEMNT